MTRIFIHPQFNAANLKNDIAILRLSSAVPLGQTPTMATVCLPSNQISNQRCWIAGWGRNDFVTGSYQAIMKQVDVPLVDQATCQSQLRATRLGSNFALDTVSFMCAGGESGKGSYQSSFGRIQSIIYSRCLHWRWRKPFSMPKRRAMVCDGSRGMGNRMRNFKCSRSVRKYPQLPVVDPISRSIINLPALSWRQLLNKRFLVI